MTNFPQPIFPPEAVQESREERLKEILRSSRRGIAIRSGIILVELAGVLLFGSSALLMDALASLIDVASSLVLMASIKLADKPPDDDHPFGHGRFEPLVGLQIGLMLILIGGGMLFQQFFQLFNPIQGETISQFIWIIPFGAFIFLEVCYRVVMRTAKKQNSPALAADAAHYRVDSISSFLAGIALILGAFFPNFGPFFDHLGAVFIALLMIGIGIKAFKQNLHQIMDRIPDIRFFTMVKNASKRVSGVLGTEKIRIQLYGPDAHVDIDVEVDPKLSVEIAHKISQKVRVEIQKEWPAVRDVTVHIEPYYPNDH